jgi:hypothetical protein
MVVSGETTEKAHLGTTAGARLFMAATLGALLLGTLALHANPARDARRLVNGRAADLTPLIKWWTNHSGTRPLTAWVHVRGPIVGTNAGCWVVQAQVEHARRDEAAGETSSHVSDKLLLKNPPLRELAEFQQLTAQLKALEEARGQVHAQEQQAKSTAEALAKEQNINRRYRSAQTRRARLTENEAKAELKPLDQQIQDVKQKLAIYPSAGHYEVDCFALDIGQTYSGLSLYDHGQVFK